MALILLAAASLRLTGIDWDGYHHYHPDERYVSWVATTIEWPGDWRGALPPQQSSFNPYFWPPDAASEGIQVEQDQPRDFAYGHLPLYLGVAATRLAEWLEPLTAVFPQSWLFTQDILNEAGLVEFRHLTAVARALTGLVDVGTVWLTFLLGRRLYGVKVGWVAAAFLALNVMHIQLAHFFAVDPYMTFFVMAAVYLMTVAVGEAGQTSSVMRHTSNRSLVKLLLAAVFVGLAVGSKFAAVLLLAPLAVTVWLGWRGRWGLWLGTAVLTAFLAFFLTNPFAILDLTCEVITPEVRLGPVTIPRLDWRSCYLENIATQSAMVRGDLDLPFTRQYNGTLPYLYFIEMQLKWGMGPLLGLAAFAGLGWAVWREAKRLKIERLKIEDLRLNANHQSSIVNLIVLAWVIPYFLTTGAFYVKFMRYMQPLTPFLMVFGAAMVMSWKQKWRWTAVSLILFTTALYALSFVNLYKQPHPWIAASQWIYANVEPGALILSEQWDDSLPSSLWVGDKYRRRTEYRNAELTWHTGIDANDDAEKLAANLERLAEAEYLTLVSNRVYGVVPRLPEMYPISSQYHQLLFDGALGYEVVAVYGRFPNLFGIHLQPDTFGWPGLEPGTAVAAYLNNMPGIAWGRADESFLVYDQPLVMVFRNTGKLSVAEMTALFE